MKKLLDPENLFWRCVGRVADYFLLSMTWMACCLPLLTAGTATIALYDAVANCIRGDDDNLFRRYFGTFRRELLRGIALTTLWIVLGWVMLVGFNVVTYLAESSSLWSAFRWAYLLTLILPLGVLSWGPAIRSHMGKTRGMALRLALSDLPRTLAVGAMLVAAVAAVRYVPYLVLFLPAALAHGQSAVLEPALEIHLGSEKIE